MRACVLQRGRQRVVQLARALLDDVPCSRPRGILVDGRGQHAASASELSIRKPSNMSAQLLAMQHRGRAATNATSDAVVVRLVVREVLASRQVLVLLVEESVGVLLRDQPSKLGAVLDVAPQARDRYFSFGRHVRPVAPSGCPPLRGIVDRASLRVPSSATLSESSECYKHSSCPAKLSSERVLSNSPGSSGNHRNTNDSRGFA